MKILIIQLAKMGDLFQSMKLIENTKLNYPNAELFILHDQRISEVLKIDKTLHSVPICIERIAELRENHFVLKENEATARLQLLLKRFDFDLVINLNSSKIAEQIIAYLPCQKLGFASHDLASQNWLYFWMSFIKSRPFSTMNLVDLYAGILPFKKRKQQKFIWNKNIKNILIQVGTRNPKRQLTAEFWSKTATLLIEKGFVVSLIGGKEDTHIAQKIQLQNPKIQSFVGKTTLQELFQLMQKSDLVLTCDTGPMHIAAYYRIPTIALFMGPAYYPETAGYSNSIKVFSPKRTAFSCYPCEDNTTCPYNLACHNVFSPLTILEAIEKNVWDEKTPYFDALGMAWKEQTESYELYVADMMRRYASFIFYDAEPKNTTLYSKSFKTKFKRNFAISKKLLQQEKDPTNYPFPFLFYWNKLLGYDFVLEFRDWMEEK